MIFLVICSKSFGLVARYDVSNVWFIRYNERRTSLVLSALASFPFTFLTILLRSIALAAIVAIQVLIAVLKIIIFFKINKILVLTNLFDPLIMLCPPANWVDFSPSLDSRPGKQLELTTLMQESNHCVYKRSLLKTKSQGDLRTPTSSWRSFGPLDFVHCALHLNDDGAHWCWFWCSMMLIMPTFQG